MDGRAGQPRVLVVEDDDLVRSLLVVALEGEGWRVLESDHVLEPVDVSQLRPKVIVLDVRLDGEGDGWRQIEGLRGHASVRKIPVVVCTSDRGHARAGADRLRRLGATVLIKPFDVGDLLRAVVGRDGP